DMVLKLEVCQADRRRGKRAGLDDVAAGLQVLAVNVLDELGLTEYQRLGAVPQRDGMVPKTLAAVILFGWLFREDQRPHRAVHQEYALGQEFFQDVAGRHLRRDQHALLTSRGGREYGSNRSIEHVGMGFQRGFSPLAA